MKKLMMLAALSLSGHSLGAATPLSQVLKQLGAAPGAPDNYFSDETELEYSVRIFGADDKERRFPLTASRYVGKKYIYGVTTQFPVNLSDFMTTQEGIKLHSLAALSCLNISRGQFDEIQAWTADKIATAITSTGGSYRRNFGIYQAAVFVGSNGGTYATASIWRLDRAAGTVKWPKYCTIDGVLAY